MSTHQIRNFCIIAHIDHGKSTLADRLLEQTSAVDPRLVRDQILDDMELERERGITIKARAVALSLEHEGETYRLNLIDTPGHVDFSYEVSRSLAACEGVLLLVDASQGIEAQTLANFYLALDADLAIVPIINKTDHPLARIDDVADEVTSAFGVDADDILRVSAKLGTGVEAVLGAIVEQVPAPQGDPSKPLRALIFDAVFDNYRGVVVYVRVVDGCLRRGDSIRMMTADRTFQVDEVGMFSATDMIPCQQLSAGEVGYCMAAIRSIHDVDIGDTLCHSRAADVAALPGYRKPQPMVFCGLFPSRSADFETLRRAIEKLSLNDCSFVFEAETSDALGFGFRCGFLGMLHMEIVQERLERESGIELVQTAPNVTYEVLTTDGDVLRIDNPAKTPDQGHLQELREPIVRACLIVPTDYVGALMALAEARRGAFVRCEYLSTTRVMYTYDMPLAEIVYDFFDKLKSATRGYGTMDYEFVGFKADDLVRLDVVVAGKRIDALSTVAHRSVADMRGRRLVQKLREEIPRHLFEVAVQAAIGSRVIARESIPALSKHVTGKCYGGDITRKRKLWAKQRAGKKRLKQVGHVELPQEAFLAVLATD